MTILSARQSLWDGLSRLAMGIQERLIDRWRRCVRPFVSIYVDYLNRRAITGFLRRYPRWIFRDVTVARRLSEEWLHQEDLGPLQTMEDTVLGLFATGELERSRELCELWLDVVVDQISRALPFPRYFDCLKEILIVTGDYEKVRSTLQRATERLSRAGDREIGLYWGLRGLSHVANCAGRKTEAEPPLREAVALGERLYGATSEEYAQRAFELAGVLALSNRFDEAIQFGYRAMEAHKGLPSYRDPALQANLVIELAFLYFGRRDFLRTKELLLEAEDLLDAALPPGASPGGRRARAMKFFERYLSFIFSLTSEVYQGGEDRFLDVVAEGFEKGLEDLVDDFEPSILVELKLVLAQWTLQTYLGQEPFDLVPDSVGEELMLKMEEFIPESEDDDVEDHYPNIEWLRRFDSNEVREEEPSGSDSPAQAEAKLRRNLARCSSLLGGGHSDTAAARYKLARHLYEHGQVREAEEELRRAVATWSESGGNNLHYTDGLQALAAICASTSREEEAWTLLSEVVEIENRVVSDVFAFTSESQRSAFQESLRETYFRSLAVATKLATSSSAVTRKAFELVLHRKGLIGRSQSAQWRASLRLEPGEAEDIAELRWQIASRLLAGETLADSADLAALSERQERLEAELARKVAASALPQALALVDMDDLCRALPSGSTLLEIVRCEDVREVFRFQPSWNGQRYIAFVLTAGDPTSLRLLDLGAAREIESAVDQLWQAMAGWCDPARDFIITRPASPRGPAAETLRQRLSIPLLGPLPAGSQILISPDGDLNLLPFEILPDGKGGCLIDHYNVSYLSSGREVLRFGAPLARPGVSVVVAEPLYNLGESPAENSALIFKDLPEARIEGEEVARLLEADLWAGKDALETKLREVHSPHILHMATHGFLFDTDYGSSPLGRLQEQELWRNPMLQSGLALAGANTWLQGGRLPTDAGDGLLTAAEVAALDLVDTELVVLSACRTGLGQVKVGEGVFGLRRSFALAGARTLVISLWQVPDRETRELMVRFYHYLLEEKKGRAESLRAAQLDLKRRELPPSVWGAFICQGDPGPLQLRPKLGEELALPPSVLGSG